MLSLQARRRTLLSSAALVAANCLLISTWNDPTNSNFRPAITSEIVDEEAAELRDAAQTRRSAAELKRKPEATNNPASPVDDVLVELGCSTAADHWRPHGIMHNKDPAEVKAYEGHYGNAIGKRNDFWEGDSDWSTYPTTQTLGPGATVAIWSAAFLWPMGSAFGSDQETGEMVDARKFSDHIKWIPYQEGAPVPNHEGTIMKMKDTTIIHGDTVVYFSWISDNFGHFFHDTVPVLAWLKYAFPNAKNFILPDHPRPREIIGFLDPDFASKVTWLLPQDYVWKWHHDEEPYDSVRVEDGTLTVVGDGWYHPKKNDLYYPYFRKWISEAHPQIKADVPRTVIYYSRAGHLGQAGGALHGRVLHPQQELDVLAIIKGKMKQYGRDEELVIFDGFNNEDNPMPIEQQYATFRSASSVIGPHGSGLANLLWTEPFPKSCSERVKVVEFIPGRGSVHQVFRGYFDVMWGLPFEWHAVTYAPNSTLDTTYLELTDLESALDAMWGSEQNENTEGGWQDRIHEEGR